MTLRDGPLRFLLPALGLLLSACGEPSPSTKVVRIEGADAAWNASRLLPGRALYKSQPIWEVEARPGDVLGLRILDEDQDSAYGLDAQLMGYADLYYVVPENDPSLLQFSRREDSLLLGETIVGIDLNSEEAQAWFASCSRQERSSLHYVYLEEAFPSFRELLMESNHSSLILRIGESFEIDTLEGMELYGLVCSDAEPADYVSPDPTPPPPPAVESQEAESPPSLPPPPPPTPDVREEIELPLGPPPENPLFDLGALARMRSLRFLIVDDRVDFSQLSGLDQLTSVRLEVSTRNRHLDALGKLTSLESVSLSIDSDSLTVDLTPLGALPLLSSLWALMPAVGFDRIARDLVAIGFPVNLTNEQFDAVLQQNPNLEAITMVSCENLTHLASVSTLEKLRSLYLQEPNSALDLTSLGTVSSLNFLTVVVTERLDYLPSLYGLTNLRRLILDRDHVGEEEVRALKAALPECDVVGYCMGSFWIVIALALAFAIGSALRHHRRIDHP